MKNLQGDVSSIYDGCGNIVAGYHYDAWGKVLNVWNFTDANIGDLNPFRYRGYYYDTETGLYYLNSRYYDPETGRFINSDSTKYLGAGGNFTGYNMFAYCLNNPVNLIDRNGKYPDSPAGYAGQIFGELIYELTTGKDHPSSQTRELENQIIMEQNEMWLDGIKACWTAWVQSVELQAQQKYRQDMTVIEIAEYFMENPSNAMDVITSVVGVSIAPTGLAATAGIITIPVVGQIALGVVGAVCTIWGAYRVMDSTWQDIFGEDNDS